MDNQIKFTKEQLQNAINSHLLENGNINEVFEMVVNGLMLSERSEFLASNDTENNKGNGYRKLLACTFPIASNALLYSCLHCQHKTNRHKAHLPFPFAICLPHQKLPYYQCKNRRPRVNTNINQKTIGVNEHTYFSFSQRNIIDCTSLKLLFF